MKKDLELILTNFENDLKSINNRQEIDQLKNKYLLKNGLIASAMSKIKDIPQDERAEVGIQIHELSVVIEDKIDEISESFKEKKDSDLYNAQFDITKPGKKRHVSKEHVLESMISKIEEFFLGLGFEISSYSNHNVLSDYHIKLLEELKGKSGPISILSTRTFVDDRLCQTKNIMEGVVIERDIKVSDLKGVMKLFTDYILGDEFLLIYRACYFDIIKPAVEIDVCRKIDDKQIDKNHFINIIECGIINPDLLENNGLDSKYSGFAFCINLDNLLSQIM